MKKQYLAYAMVPVLSLGLLGAGAASAHGWFGGWGSVSSDDIVARQEVMFQQQADLLGISVDQFKEKWADGKSLQEIAKELGMTQEQLRERILNAEKEKLKAQLQALVNKGIITQAQADRRLQAMEQRFNGAKLGWGRGRGFHHGFWFR